MNEIISIEELRNSFITSGLLTDSDATEDSLKKQFNKAILNFMAEMVQVQIDFVRTTTQMGGGLLPPAHIQGMNAIIAFLEGAAAQWSEESRLEFPLLTLDDFPDRQI